MATKIRRNIKNLAPSGPEITAFKRGIAEMMRRPDTDPTSWIYQANIHGTSDRPALPGWSSCQHGNFFFLSWHRMYLYWLERILRAASAEPTLALPFWDYSDRTQRALPRVFRTPADASNPLYVERRSTAMNQGGQLFASDVDNRIAFRSRIFSAPTAVGPGFGGYRVPPNVGGPPGLIEAQPHNVIHGKIGGWMGVVRMAARDPIFWLHHVNIDRLWTRWLEQGEGRSNPGHTPAEEIWHTHRFVFFDENGSSVSMTGADIIDTVGQLDYRYEPDPAVIPVTRRDLVPPAAPSMEWAMDQPERALMGTSRRRVIDLGADLVRVPIEVLRANEDATAERARTVALTEANVWASAEEGPILLMLEGIHFDPSPGVSYEIYLNLPEGKEPNYRGRYYVGNLGFFAQDHGSSEGEHGPAEHQHQHHQAVQEFDITSNVRALEKHGEWRGQPTSVTFVQRGLRPRAGKAAARAAAVAAERRPEPNITVDRVTITMSEVDRRAD